MFLAHQDRPHDISAASDRKYGLQNDVVITWNRRKYEGKEEDVHSHGGVDVVHTSVGRSNVTWNRPLEVKPFTAREVAFTWVIGDSQAIIARDLREI